MTDDWHLAAAISDICSAHHAFTPPSAGTVAEGAQQVLVIKQPGAAGGPWSAEETPYMVEPMNMLASRLHEAVVFAGPARTGKTMGLLIGAAAHFVVNDPGDLLFVQMTQDKAREFSKTDVRRAIDNSPKLRAMLSVNAADRNTHDIMFKNGVWLRIAWPTVSNVSGSTYRFAFITDLDRIPNAENIEGEGPLFDLARKRTTTLMSRGMCLAESSPGIEITDPGWAPATPHEAPPVTGILGIYNRSDRRRWYWQCPDCESDFEAAPGLGLFNLPDDRELVESVRTSDITAMAKKYGSRIICPHCGVEIPFSKRIEMNRKGKWVSDGEITSKIAGYWLGGVAATYQTWESLVLRYLSGLRDYVLTGSEEALKATINTDQGMPYMARHLVEMRANSSSPKDRAEDMRRYVCPPETRALLASVDVQGGSAARFVVQVHAIGPFGEQWLVDRFDIRNSKREGMGEDFAPIDPAAYPEDWDVLTDKLLLATWRTPDTGREIKLRAMIVDSGGEDGVTANAYAYYRRCRAMKLSDRVHLYKGTGTKQAPIIKRSWVGKRKETDKGDIPLYVCNTNLLSDAVDTGLRRQTPGPWYIHFPMPKNLTTNPDGWLPAAFFDELGAEVRGPDGVWMKVRKRNESFDLCRMIRALALILGIDKIKDWSVVPPWLAPLDQNNHVVSVQERREMKENEVVMSVQPTVRVIGAKKRPRRSVPSPYLR